MKRDRPVLRGLMAAGLSWTLLVGAITLGMLVPRQELLSGFGSDGELDYSAYGSGFSPLSLAFVADILGLEDPRSADTTLSNGGPDAAVASGGTSALGETAAAPTDVEHPFTNDDIGGAYKVSSLPFRGRTDTSEGTRRLDEPADCSPAGGTAWYRYRPTTDVALFSDTFGTSRPIALGVYSRTGTGPLELIGCDTNALGNAQVGFSAAAGTVYYFQVTSIAQGGSTIFGLAAVGTTTVVSGAPSGAPADGAAFDRPDISADGRYVVFTSFARNLTPRAPDCGNHAYCQSVYLRDRVTRQTVLVASNGISGPEQTSGGPAVSNYFEPAISPDGRYVGFSLPMVLSQGASGLPDAKPIVYSAFLYDRVTERVKLVSRNSKGEPARRDLDSDPGGGSAGPSISSDGRYVVFMSNGDNMPGQSEESTMNVYRRDLVTGRTRLVSTTPSGRPNHSHNCAFTGRNVSGDGRYAVFYSGCGSCDGGRTLVWLWDARTGRSRLVSKVLPGRKKVLGSYCPSISLDGSRVGLVSKDPLVPEDTNRTPDVYVYEVATGRIQRISVTSDGKQTHDPNYEGREHGLLQRSVNLSANGRFAVFDSSAPDLAPSAVGSTRHPPETTRVFMHDILTGATVLVSVSSTGEPLGGDSHMPYISADGSAVAFMNATPGGLERVMVHELSFFR